MAVLKLANSSPLLFGILLSKIKRLMRAFAQSYISLDAGNYIQGED